MKPTNSFGRTLSSAASTFITVLLICIGSSSVAAPQPTSKHLVLDDRVILSVQNARLRPGTAQKDPRNPLMPNDKLWEDSLDNLYANVIYDTEESVFKLWYHTLIVSPEARAKMMDPADDPRPPRYNLYATSADAEGGSVRVGVASERMPNDCIAVTSDVTDHPIQWKHNASQMPIKGRIIRLVFELEKATLYTFSGLQRLPAPITTPTGPRFRFHEHVKVEIAAPQGCDCILRFTTDGVEPTCKSPVYEAPLLITQDTVVKSRLFPRDCTDGGPIVTTELLRYRSAGTTVGQRSAAIKHVSTFDESGDPYTAAELESFLINEVYNQAVILVTVDKDPDKTWNFDLDNDGKLDVAGPGDDEYTEEQNEIITNCTPDGSYDAVVFIVANPDHDDQRGQAIRGSGYAWVFWPGEGNVKRTTAHEIGHGTFWLRHPDGDFWNLMWAGFELRGWQWVDIHFLR